MIIADEQLEATAQFFAHEDPQTQIIYNCDEHQVSVVMSVRGADVHTNYTFTLEELDLVMTRVNELSGQSS